MTLVIYPGLCCDTRYVFGILVPESLHIPPDNIILQFRPRGEYHSERDVSRLTGDIPAPVPRCKEPAVGRIGLDDFSSYVQADQLATGHPEIADLSWVFLSFL